MTKKDIAILGRAFDCEVRAALSKCSPIMQTKSAIADCLVSEGLLEKSTERIGIATIEGYTLTHAGRFAYCAICEDEES